MSMMQVFYNQLSQAREVHDPDLDCLAKLTGTNPVQIMAALKSSLEWMEWGVESPGTSAPTTE